MSIYVTSDLHGLPLADLKRLLNMVNFNDDDWLLFLEEHRRRAMSELSIYNEGIKLLPKQYITAQIIPVKAHIRHLKADLPCEGQIQLEV